MIIASASKQVSSDVASKLINTATLGLAHVAKNLQADAEAAQRKEPLLDMRLEPKLRELILQKAAEIGGAVDDDKVRSRYGRQERLFTRARFADLDVMLLQIDRAILSNGDQLGKLDEIQYALAGKIVRVFSPELPAPTASFNTLQQNWFEDKKIQIECVPWLQVQELEQGAVDLAQVLKVSPGSATLPATGSRDAQPGTGSNDLIRIFVSYAHHDSEFVDEMKDKSIVAYMKGALEKEGFRMWWDRKITAGDLWDDEIAKELAAAHIVLALVSQRFLNSKYCSEVEMPKAVERRKTAGMVVFPVIVSSCDWQSHDWLRSTQFEPRDGKTLETDYTQRGARDQLYLQILEQLRMIGKAIRRRRA